MDERLHGREPETQTPPRQRSGASEPPRTRGPIAVRRGMMLLLVLMTLMLAVAVITPLATLSGVEAVTSAHRAATLRHRLAAESLIATLPELLQSERRLNRDLDRSNRTEVAIAVGEVRVRALLQDDTAKLPLPLLFQTGGSSSVEQALTSLRGGAALPALAPMPALGAADSGDQSSLRWNGCLDDLFTAPTDAALFGTARTPRVWAQYVTPSGSAVHIVRADAAVLEALLCDLQPGLGQRLAAARETQFDQTDIDGLLATLELPESVAQEAARRLTCDTHRYSMLIRTEIGNDVRQRYVICTATPRPQVLIDWEVAP